MTDEFDLIIDYKSEHKIFPAILLLQGYTHKFKVLVDGVEVFFEPDPIGPKQGDLLRIVQALGRVIHGEHNVVTTF